MNARLRQFTADKLPLAIRVVLILGLSFGTWAIILWIVQLIA